MKLIREIRDQNGKLVFRRYQILRTRWFSIFLHGMYDQQGDRDKHCHDHPWPFISIILWGGYFEVLYNAEERWRWYRYPNPLSIKYMPSTGIYHRILRLKKAVSYSLVFARPAHRWWGYWTQEGHLDNVTYRERKRAGTLPKG